MARVIHVADTMPREELGRRFRSKYGFGVNGEALAALYLIGVFDTVASLGAKGLLRMTLGFALASFVAVVAAALAVAIHAAFGVPWLVSRPSVIGVMGAIALWRYLRTSLKVMWPPLPGRRLPNFQIAQ